MKITKRQLARYINAAADLAESVKKDIVKNGAISDKTVLALNELYIISNEITDFTDEINVDKRKAH